MERNERMQALEHESVRRLLVQYSLPAIAGMAAMSLYNVIDSIFIGHGCGPLALSGLAVAFPIMNLAVALCTLVGLGSAAASSIMLGRRDRAAAFRVLGHCLLLSILFGILFGWGMLPFLDHILVLFGASPATLPYARDFMSVLLMVQPLTFCFINLNHVMRATGYPRKAMWSLLFSMFCNLVLAPIFIFLLKWGMTGAAVATSLSQAIAFTWVLRHFLQNGSVVHFMSGIYRIQWKLVLRICFLGMPPCLMNACGAAITILINHQLLAHGGDLAVGAFGIINRLLILFAMLVIGITQGMQPIAGFNLGAGHFDRVKKVLRYALLAATGVTTLGFLLCELFPHGIVAMFTQDASLAAIAVFGLRASVAIFPLVGSQIVIGNFFQAIGRPVLSVFLALTRQLLFLAPLLLILPDYFGQRGVWYSLAASDALSVTVGFGALFCFFRHTMKAGQKPAPSVAPGR